LLLKTQLTLILSAYRPKDPFLKNKNKSWMTWQNIFKKSKMPCKTSQQTFFFQGWGVSVKCHFQSAFDDEVIVIHFSINPLSRRR
jgi:hypothetical protein